MPTFIPLLPFLYNPLRAVEKCLFYDPPVHTHSLKFGAASRPTGSLSPSVMQTHPPLSVIMFIDMANKIKQNQTKSNKFTAPSLLLYSQIKAPGAAAAAAGRRAPPAWPRPPAPATHPPALFRGCVGVCICDGSTEESGQPKKGSTYAPARTHAYIPELLPLKVIAGRAPHARCVVCVCVFVCIHVWIRARQPQGGTHTQRDPKYKTVKKQQHRNRSVPG